MKTLFVIVYQNKNKTRKCDEVAVSKPLNHCIDCVTNNQPEDQPDCLVRILVV